MSEEEKVNVGAYDEGSEVEDGKAEEIEDGVVEKNADEEHNMVRK
jgi:hypothetical protein